MLATAPHCAAPGVNGFALPQLKRKRSDSSDSTTGGDVPVATKLRTGDAPSKQVSAQQHSSAPKEEAASIPTRSPTDRPSERAPDSSPALRDESQSDPSLPARENQKPTARKVDVDRLRETLEAQLSLEVLLKHNELRLIDQEIAKCQVALEQLRRCAEIPYPGSQAAGSSQSVSSGTGMSVWAPGNGPAPLSPAPWGVADGPYTRHYARWLLSDPRFDGGEVEPATPLGIGAMTPLEGRSTRGNPIDTTYLAGKSTRPQRGSTGAKLQSLPSGYPAPKERAGPMIIRRKSDNVLVKLVCLDCRRDNFSSTQGFINHCRIAHNRNFASHDAAAVASGEPVEVDDAGAVVGGKTEPPAGVTPGFVHPLIRSAHVIDSTSRTPSQSRSLSTVETPRTSSQTPLGPKTPTANASSESFTASEDTPHLSSLMQLRGVGLDLGQLVGEAKIAVDLDGYSSEEAESESDPTSPSAEAQASTKPLSTRAGRQPMRTTVSQTASRRPDGHKGVEKPNHKPFSLETLTPTRPPAPYQSPYAPAGSQMNELRDVDGTDLSPNTVESNQAPSLVSDDDDFEAASDSDSPGPSSSEAEDGEGEFSLIDVEDDEDATGSTTTNDSNPKPGVGMASGGKPLQRGNIRKKAQYMPSSVVPLSRGKDEKHLNPATITLQTFTTLLAHYEETTKRVARNKALARQTKTKSKPKPKPKQKQKQKREAPLPSPSSSASVAKESGSASDGKSAEDRWQAWLDHDTAAQVEAAVRGFWELDWWRYEQLPAVVRGRRQEGAGAGAGRGSGEAYLLKEEAVKLMEWKLKHGIYRPTLLSMISSNQERAIQTATAAAFEPPPPPPVKPGDNAAAATAAEEWTQIDRRLEALTSPLRGVGPATASLILSIASPAEIPFYSDDVYLWLCAGVYPSLSAEGIWVKGETGGKKEVRQNGELNVKYNVPEYRRLWGAVRGLRGRLDGEGEKGASGVSCADVERVAFVVRHIEDSGYLAKNRGEGTEDVEEGKQDGRNEDRDEDEDGSRRKRRRTVGNSSLRA
ncbi:uncharacterized protein BJX67DRAFT_369529 [Aspergillus lucknowensis]|uniref:AHC1-like C2H2 zinc-finger domain-containing protein n=1 Tax=Aspergillus lucknowensis TaxID=176173 RepID=A0ABR4M6F6_9EURO